MNYTFECKSCGACGCGVSLYDTNGNHVPKSEFQKNPKELFCQQHIPIKPKVTVQITK